MEKKYIDKIAMLANRYVEDSEGFKGMIIPHPDLENRFYFIHNSDKRSGWPIASSRSAIYLKNRYTYIYGYAYTPYGIEQFKLVK